MFMEHLPKGTDEQGTTNKWQKGERAREGCKTLGLMSNKPHYLRNVFQSSRLLHHDAHWHVFWKLSTRRFQTPPFPATTFFLLWSFERGSKGGVSYLTSPTVARLCAGK